MPECDGNHGRMYHMARALGGFNKGAEHERHRTTGEGNTARPQATQEEVARELGVEPELRLGDGEERAADAVQEQGQLEPRCDTCHRWIATHACCKYDFCKDCHYLHRRYYHGDKSCLDFLN